MKCVDIIEWNINYLVLFVILCYELASIYLYIYIIAWGRIC